MLKDILRKLRFLFCLYTKKTLFWERFSDQFYAFQQDRLRGSVREIKKRQKIYIKYIKELEKKKLAQFPFLDCGFGRGEFLELLREHHISHTVGVDINKNFIKDAQEKGFNVIQSDIVKFLYVSQELYTGISAFHLIEHLSFPQLFDFLVMCNKKLVKGGILILETPNIENMRVSSTTFYYDHTHIQKLPKVFLHTLLKFIGFSKIEFLYLHPEKSIVSTETDRLLFGAQDLGVIAYK